MSTQEMESRITEYKELLAEAKQLQEMAEAIKAQLIAEMDHRKEDAIQAGPYTMRYVAYETTRVNTAKLKAAGLYDDFSSKTTALRFSIT